MCTCIYFIIGIDTKISRLILIFSLRVTYPCCHSWLNSLSQAVLISHSTWSDSKVRELIAVKVLHNSLLNTTVVAFKVLPLGSYAPMPAVVHPSKQFWNWFCGTASVVYWSEFLATDTEVPGSIPGATRFSE